MEVPGEMGGLSDDLIANILERLPKESLHGFRCVSKRWRRLIDDRFFTKLLLYLLPMFSSSLYRIDPRRPDDLVEIEYPLGWERIMLLGSCRGFLCIYNEDDGQVAIWNPSTRSCQLLPPADAEIAHRLGSPACLYGFGYDDESEDYVLLRLVQTMENPVVSAVSIYRSGDNAWRQLQGIPPYSLVDPHTMGVFLHGRLHWIMRRDLMQNSEIVLVALYIHTANSMEVHQLNFIDDSLPTYLALLGGRLCLITYGEQGGVSAWITSEYRSKISWDRLFSKPHYSRHCVLLQPLAYSQNSHQVLLLDRGNLVWYDLHTNEDEPFHIEGMPGFFKAATCFFIESHLQRSKILCLFSVDPPRLYCIDSLTDLREIEYPLGWLWIQLLGSCHHVLCISNRLDGRIAIWNPATGSCRLLAPADAEIPHELVLSAKIPHIVDPSTCVYGFGYDKRKKDHVLLRLAQTFREPIVCAVSIYRFRADTWMWLEQMPYYLDDSRQMGVFLHGRLYWIMRRVPMGNSAKVLVAFDICTEEFAELDLPNFPDNGLDMNLVVLKGCLCLTIYSRQGVIDVWSMRAYGWNRSWDMLFSLCNLPSNWERFRPLAYFGRHSTKKKRMVVEFWCKYPLILSFGGIYFPVTLSRSI